MYASFLVQEMLEARGFLPLNMTIAMFNIFPVRRCGNEGCVCKGFLC